MPKTPARDDYFAKSFRFAPEQAGTIKEEAKRLGSSTAFVRELVDDYRTMFGLPRIQVEVLEADMKNLNTSTQREYVQHLLALRYQTLLEERASGAKTSRRWRYNSSRNLVERFQGGRVCVRSALSDSPWLCFHPQPRPRSPLSTSSSQTPSFRVSAAPLT